MPNRSLHLDIDDPLPPPTEGELRALEAAVGARLPAEFVAFLTVANGGSLPYAVSVPCANGPEVLELGDLYATRDAPGVTSLLQALKDERLRRNIPDGVLPFATDGSSVAYLDLTPTGKGRVVYVHGLPAWASANADDD